MDENCLSDDEGPRVKRYKQMRKQDLLEEVLEQRRTLNVQEAKLRGQEALMGKLKGMMECPVCLSVPVEVPVPCCPVGHIICKPCQSELRRAGRWTCPTCRVRMGNSTSLLAKTLVENMEHKCNLAGCEEIVPYKEYRKHQDDCKHRVVMCPGLEGCCDELIPFCKVEDHAISTCSGMVYEVQNKDQSFGISFGEGEKPGDEDYLMWKTRMFKSLGRKFFVKVEVSEGHLYVETLMLGSPRDCEGVEAEVSLLHGKSREVVYKFFSKPRPLGKEKSLNKDDCLSVTTKSISSKRHFDKERREYTIRVKADFYSKKTEPLHERF